MNASCFGPILDLADEAFEDAEQAVLCRVVRLVGSGYGRPGARLLVTQSGRRAGYISGGCLENDLCRRVWDATRAGPRLLTFDTRGNPIDRRRGTGCEGVVSVLCQRVTKPSDPPLRVLRTALSAMTRPATLTVYRSDSSNAAVGEMWNRADWSSKAEPFEDLRDHLSNVRENGTVRFRDHDHQMVEAAVEFVPTPRRIVVFGSGSDVRPVAETASRMGWRVTVVCQRSPWPTGLPSESIECLFDEPDRAVPRLDLHAEVDVIVMSHDFDRDRRLLPILLDQPLRSIGLLGPKRRLARLVMAMHREGRSISPNEAAKIRSPVGLDIGAVTPEEIAISIVSELIAIERRRSGTSLRDREGPVHRSCPHVDLTSRVPRPNVKPRAWETAV